MSADSVVLGACCVLCCVPPDRVPNSIPAPEHELRPSLRPGWRQGEQFGRVSAGLTSVRSGLSHRGGGSEQETGVPSVVEIPRIIARLVIWHPMIQPGRVARHVLTESRSPSPDKVPSRSPPSI